MTTPNTRKGVTRIADIPDDVREALSTGKIPSATLAEGLAVDQSMLTRAVFPGLSAAAFKEVDAACQLGILQRTQRIAGVLLHELGEPGIAQCQSHPSDTVRGWACFMVGAQTNVALDARLAAIRPLADDMHFGVREWAWMAVRPHLSAELDTAIASLTQWTASPSERLRRFACEAIRPRGVWCAHISALKKEPQLAHPLLWPLRADPSRYVQDSVANWLNDAAKSQPNWVRSLCAQWLQDGAASEATQRICQRALRNLA